MKRALSFTGPPLNKWTGRATSTGSEDRPAHEVLDVEKKNPGGGATSAVVALVRARLYNQMKVARASGRAAQARSTGPAVKLGHGAAPASHSPAWMQTGRVIARRGRAARKDGRGSAAGRVGV